MEEKIPLVKESQDEAETETTLKKEVILPARLEISVTTDVLGNKWRPEILWLLIQGTHRFKNLKDALPGITQRALSLQLKDLEKYGYITREVFKEVPMRVEYTITKKGLTLKPVLTAMVKWGQEQISGGKENITPVKEKKTKTPPPLPSNVLTLF